MGKYYSILTTPQGKRYECNLCDFKTDSKGAMLQHHNPKSPKKCSGRDWAAEAEAKKEKKRKTRGGVDTSEMAPREVVSMYGMAGLEELMRDRLLDYLEDAPGVSNKTKDWVMKQWDGDANIRRDSNRLYAVLTDSGVKSKIAYRVTGAVDTLYRDLAPLVGGQQPPFPTQRMQEGQRGPYWPQQQGATQKGGPFPPRQMGYRQMPGGPQQKTYTREDIERVREEAGREHRLQDVEQRQQRMSEMIDGLGARFERSINDLKNTLSQPKGKFVEENIPIDAQGNPTHPKKAVTIKKVKRPVEEEKESLLDSLSDLKEAGLIMTPEKVRDVVKEAVPQQPGKTPEIERVEEQLESVEKELQDQRFERVEDRLEASNKEVKQLREALASQPKGEYTGDQYRLLDTGLREVASREPLKVVVDFGREMMGMPGGMPPEGKTSPEARGKIIEQLRKKGYTVPR